VIGVPHPDFGEAVVAVATPAAAGPPLDETAILAQAKEQLAAFKLPSAS
jgi:acyl-CoA synthetase (AMP-forming)/AMP-acid ligase II